MTPICLLGMQFRRTGQSASILFLGKVFDKSVYESIANAENLDEIENYILEQLK